MRRIARIDANQHEVVDVFRRMGFSVLFLHQVGGGCPDILIAKNWQSYLVEIKDGKKSPSKRKLTIDQEKFHETWNGDIFIVESVEEAISLAHELEEASWDRKR